MKQYTKVISLTNPINTKTELHVHERQKHRVSLIEISQTVSWMSIRSNNHKFSKQNEKYTFFKDFLVHLKQDKTSRKN